MERRSALKIIGAVGATCAFPFGADELYGQHVHHALAQPSASGPYVPKFFSADDMSLLSTLADLIIPPSGTPGGAGAGVPAYIDLVVHSNAEHQQEYREGLRWLAEEKGFAALAEDQRIALLEPLCAAADSGNLDVPHARFFHLLKNMTADGYYTSRVGLVDELGYKGNTVLASFPSCEVREH